MPSILAFVLQFFFVPIRLSCRLPVEISTGQDRRDDLGHLVHHCNYCEADGIALKELHDPDIHLFEEATCAVNLLGRADHEKPSYITITLLANPAQASLATT